MFFDYPTIQVTCLVWSRLTLQLGVVSPDSSTERLRPRYESVQHQPLFITISDA